MKVTLIGLGSMGTAMASRILQAGYDLTVYNRTVDKAAPLVAAGAKLGRSPKDAVTNADVLITMLTDDQALNEVLLGENGALPHLPKNSIHLSMSTISDDLADRLSQLHRERNVAFIGAPVFGRPAAAAAGQLFILAAGSEKAIKDCDPLLKVLGQKVVVVGDRPPIAHLTKILGNFMLFSAIESLAEAMSVARAAGMSEQVFLQAMTSTIFSSPFYLNYGKMMVERNYPTHQAVSLNLALKDIRLAIESSERKSASLPTAQLVKNRLSAGIDAGKGHLDVSALSELAFNENQENNRKENHTLAGGPMKPIYAAQVTVTGGRAGRAFSEDGNLSTKLSFPKALGGDGSAGANPEQLLAAGYAACFESTMGFVAAGKGIKIESSQVLSTASLFNDPSGGFKLKIELEIDLRGIDAKTAMDLVEEAKKVCPYHKMAHGNIEQIYRLK